MTELDVVVPSAASVDVLRDTLPTIARAHDALEHAGRRVVVRDVPVTPSFAALATRLGFEILECSREGPGRARNIGAARTSGSFIGFVDDDLEVDPDALLTGVAAIERCGSQAVIGGLRPPAGAPSWLRWAYEDETMTPASAFVPAGWLPGISFASALCIVRRAAYDAAGRFPEWDTWGGEDALFGLNLQNVTTRGTAVWREPRCSAVHLFSPTWGEWLQRRHRTGERLAEIVRELDEEQASVLLPAYGLGRGVRLTAKRLIGRRRWRPQTPPRLRALARAAGATAVVEGYSSRLRDMSV